MITDGDPNDGSVAPSIVRLAIARAQASAAAQSRGAPISYGSAPIGVPQGPPLAPKAKGVLVMAIGLGTDLDPLVLKSLASEPTPQYSILLSEFTSLDLLAKLLSAQCTPVLTG